MKNTLEMILEIFGDRNLVLARELTKIHEEFIRGKVSEILNKIDEIKGEFVILIEGSTESEKDKEISNLNSKTLEEHYEFYKSQGITKKEIIKKLRKIEM